MGNYDLKKKLFRHEVDVVEKAKKRLKDASHTNDETLINDYRELTKEYEKLLKLTLKSYRISDIQGKMLKEQEDEITRVNNDLRKMEETRKRFISDIAHEMGAPIRAILSFLKIVVDGKTELDPKYIQLMYERMLGVNELLKDLFDLSILEVNGSTFTFEQVPIVGLIKTLAEKYELDVKTEGINFSYEEIPQESSSKDQYVKVDLLRMEQVITNLINNAIKYTPSGGTISVFSEVADRSSDESRFLIKIKDTGAGMGKEEIDLIFDRYYKGHQHMNSTGLGLAISKEIISKHHGSIEVSSEENEGSTFIISLPITKKNGDVTNETASSLS